MATDPSSSRLDDRAGRDAAADDAKVMRRSIRTWVVLTGVWVVGLGVWVVYLATLGYLVVRVLG